MVFLSPSFSVLRLKKEKRMNEPIIFIILFASMFFFHELGHVAYAKSIGIYKKITIFRLYHLSKKIPQKGLGMLPLGAGVETDLEKETLHQRVFNCLCGTLAGLPFLLIGWFFLPTFECVTLIMLYMIGYFVDLITVLQIAVIGRKEGFRPKLVEVI